jgi:uncharacterized integral membrane protein
VGTVIVVLVAVGVVVMAALGLLFARRRVRTRERNRALARAQLQQAQQLEQRADTERAAGQMQAALAQRERILAEQRVKQLEHQAQEKMHQADAERDEAAAERQRAHELAPELNEPTWQPPPQLPGDASLHEQATWVPPQTRSGPRAQAPPYRPTSPPGAAPPAGQPAPPTPQPVPAGPEQPSPASARPDQPLPGLDRRGRVRGSRAGGIWVGLIASAIVLVALLVFILQNSQTVVIHFLGFAGHLSFAVALLIAAVCGLLLIAVTGTVRIIQLRRALKTTAGLASTAASGPPPPSGTDT